MDERSKQRATVIVGKPVIVRTPATPPEYFTDAHTQRIGEHGIAHAIVAAIPRENPLVKVKFADDKVIFFRLAELDVRHGDTSAPTSRHGERASHLPKSR
jgi:hypothetical protein